MTVESSSDFDSFFNLDDFGISAVYTPFGESSTTISVLFDDPFSSVALNATELDIESTAPTAFCKSSDCNTVAHGDSLAIGSITYHEIGIEKDNGSGYQNSTMLILEKQ